MKAGMTRSALKRTGSIVWFLAGGFALAPVGSLAQAPTSLPVYNVIWNRVPDASAKLLASQLKLAALPVSADGSVQYMNAGRFQQVPTKQLGAGPKDEHGNATTQEALDFANIAKIRALPPTSAQAITDRALKAAGLLPAGATASFGNSSFEAYDIKGNRISSVSLDTHVNYSVRLENLRLIGPGAKIKLVLAGDGSVTNLNYSWRGLQRGSAVPLISPATAEKIARLQLADQSAGGPIELKYELVYYAPPMSVGSVRALYPHYKFVGTQYLKDGSALPLRSLLVPAISNVPTAKISASASGSKVTASVAISGGTAPYSVYWNSSHTTFSPSFAQSGPKIAYSVMSQTSQALVDLVSATIVDANGLIVTAKLPVTVLTPLVFIRYLPDIGGARVGTEWIGLSAGLGGSAANAGGFVAQSLANAVPVMFNWGDLNAWERDFKDPAFAGGNDTNWVDAVDMVFYTGHANGDGFAFTSLMNDTFLSYTDAYWGNRDLEWLVIAACGPLQEWSSGLTVRNRWGRAFKGLHILMGYATTSLDNVIEGSTVAGLSMGAARLPIRCAWMHAAQNSQPADVIWGAMGPIRADGVSNFNDHFWGRGAVGPDIRGAAIWGFWVLRAPC